MVDDNRESLHNLIVWNDHMNLKVLKGLNYKDISLMNALKSKVVLLYSLILANAFIQSKR